MRNIHDAPFPHPIPGRCAWRAGDLTESDWSRPLDAAAIDALDSALKSVNRRGLATLDIAREDFPLPGMETLIRAIQDELETGLGFLRLTGLPAERYSLEDLRRLFWGLGRHVGTAVNQSARGEWIGEVRDESADAEKTYAAAGPDEVRSSRARARSTGPLRFHTDRCDVIALLCARNALTGGVSKIASSAAIHNLMLERRPDLVAVLYRDFWRARPADEDGPWDRAGGPPCFALPVFAVKDGWFTSQYSRTYVEQAQENNTVPRLTPDQVAAMDLLAEIAEEVCLHAPFAAGDIQFCNNHVIYHGRTAYDDDRGAGRARHLLRLWLSPPRTRPLPDGFEVAWGSVAPNAVRGGFPVRTTAAA